jgi:hypothetical protein
MSDPRHDAGVIQTMLDRLNNQGLPRALDLRKKVDAGEVLDDFDLRFLAGVFSDARAMRPMVDRHPEYQALVARMIHLYKEIVERALANESKR